jgi:hypothetical protein
MLFVKHSPTSYAAAVENAAHSGTQRRRVFDEIYRSHGATDHEMQKNLAMNSSTQRPRRVELVRMGLVRDSGRKRLTPSGRWAVVWDVVVR